MTAAHPPPPNNHGKKWTMSEDEHITDAPGLTDAHYAQLLRRSEQAVHSRRAVLAAKLHKSSGRPLAECAETLRADVKRTTLAVSSHDAKRTPILACFPNQPTPAANAKHTPPRHRDSAIASICDHIKRTNGDIDGIWARDELVPTLVQCYVGVQAYATFVAKFNPRDRST